MNLDYFYLKRKLFGLLAYRPGWLQSLLSYRWRAGVERILNLIRQAPRQAATTLAPRKAGGASARRRRRGAAGLLRRSPRSSQGWKAQWASREGVVALAAALGAVIIAVAALVWYGMALPQTSLATNYPAVAQTPVQTPALSGGHDAPASFKVSGVTSGPRGEAALINGQIIYVGQTVDGARLTAISRNSVQLLVGDKQITVAIQQ
jgi:hypothetical protein